MPGATHDTETSLRRAVDLLLEIDTFAWQLTQSANNKPKAVWTGPGQRRPLYGAAAVKAANRSAGGSQQTQPVAAPPARPAPPPPPIAPPAVAAPAPPALTPASGGPTPAPTAPTPGRARRAAQATGAGAKAVGKAALTVGAKLQIAGAWTVEKTMAQMVKLGNVLKRFTWLERNTGIGRLVEKEASRRMRRAAAVKAAAAAGGLGAGVKTFAAEAAKAVGLRYRTNRRKYGRVAAAVMEAVALGLSVTKKAKSFLLNVPLLSVALKPIAAVVGTLANAATRGALNFLGKRLLAKREVKRNPDAPGRVAQRMDKGKPVALPTAVVSRARDIRRGTGPGDLVPTNGATTSRSRRFAEAYPDADIDPVEFVTDLRGFVEQIVGGPLDVADGELAEVVEATVGLLEARAAGRA